MEIGGVVVERATLHNEREINRLGLYVGATVSVMRAGDVIPKIVGIANSSVRGSRTDGVSVKEADYSYSLPQHCPVCHSPTVRECTPEPSSKLSGNRSESELLRNSATRVKCTGGRWVCAAQAVELIRYLD